MAHSHIAGIMVAPMEEEKVPPGAGEGSTDDALLKPRPPPRYLIIRLKVQIN